MKLTIIALYGSPYLAIYMGTRLSNLNYVFGGV